MNIFRDVLTQAFILLAVTCPSFSYPNPGETSDPHELLRRAGTTSYFGDYTGSTSSYPDGSGTYIRSEDVGTYASGIKCWTDLFYVKNSYQAESWTLLPDNSIDCGSTSSCSSGTINGTSSCLTSSISVSLEVSLDIVKDFLGVSGSTSYSWGSSNCTSTTASNTCTWEDGKCHSLWVSDVVQHFDGYIRRRCHNNVDYTAWSHDISMDTPAIDTRLGCNAVCNDTSYPDPVPPPPEQ